MWRVVALSIWLPAHAMTAAAGTLVQQQQFQRLIAASSS